MYNKQLDTFIKAAELGSLSKAAEALYVTPSAVIQQINNLEAELDTKLFLRSNRGIALTEAGEYLLIEGKSLIAKAVDIQTHLAELKGKTNRTITVGTNAYHTPRRLYELWFKFDMVYPEYRVRTRPIGDITGESIEDVDLVEGIRFCEGWQKDYDFLHYENDPVSIALPRSHPLSSKKLLIFEDLSGTPIVVIKQGLSEAMDVIHSDLESHGIQTIPVDIYDASVNIMCMTRQYGLLMPECWTLQDSQLMSIPVDWDYTNQYGFFFRKKLSAPAKKLYDFILELKESQ